MTRQVFKRTAMLFSGLSAWSLPAAAQTIMPPPPPPTTQQAMAADQRQGTFFQFNGANIFYQVAGQGTPLILIHGYPLSGDMFSGQLSGLSSNFQVITLDLPGFGKSTAPTANGSIAGYAQYVLALMDQLNIPSAIIGGHSMGGQITLEIYHEAPQRVSGLLLIDTNPMAASIVEQAEFPAFGLQASKLGVPSIVPALAPQMVTGATLKRNDQLANDIMNILAEGSVNGAIAGGEALATRPDYTTLLGSIAVPTLVVVGVDDPVYPVSISQMTASEIPNAQLAIIPAAAHASNFERANLVNQAIKTSSLAGQ